MGLIVHEPEQAKRRKIPVDHRTDIYSLGATLYELLTRQQPFRGKDHQDTLSEIISSDPRPPRRCDSRIPRDLETIVLKCLHKNPHSRYSSARELAADLRSFAHGEPIAARPQPAWEKAVRRAWRNKRRIAALAAFLVVVFFVTLPFLKEGSMTTRLVWEGPSREASVSLDGRYVAFVDWANGGDLAVRDLKNQETRRLTNRASWAKSGERAGYPVISSANQRVAYSWSTADGPELRVVGLDGSEPRTVYRDEEAWRLAPIAWSPDDTRIFLVLDRAKRGYQIASVSSADGSLQVLNKLGRHLSMPISLSPDGHYLVYDAPSRDDPRSHDIFLLTADGSQEVPLIEHPADDRFPVWTPDGQGILFGSDRGGILDAWAISVVDGEVTDEPVLVTRDIRGTSPRGFTRQGDYFYVRNITNRQIHIATLDPTEGRILEPPAHSFAGSRPDWSPDGHQLAYFTVGPEPKKSVSLTIRSLERGERRELSLGLSGFTTLRWSPDGLSMLVTGSDEEGRDGVFLFDIASSRVTRLMSGLRRPEWSPDGTAIFYVIGSRIVERRLTSGDELEIYRAEQKLGSGLALSPDGQQLAFTMVDPRGEGPPSPWPSSSIWILPVTGEEPRRVFSGSLVPRGMDRLTWSPDGSALLFVLFASPRDGQTLSLWQVPVEGGEAQPLGLSMPRLRDPRVHPDGRQIAFASTRQYEEIWVIEKLLAEIDRRQ